MKFSASILVATLAILCQAAPSPSPVRQLVTRQYAEIGEAVAGLVSGFIDEIRKASPQANLKKMAKKRKFST